MDRVGNVYRVKPGKAAEYRRRHATIPGALDQLLREAGVRRFSIYLWDETVFSHLEVDSFERLVEQYTASPAAASWEEEMSELIEYPNADPNGWPLQLHEVWSL